LKTCRVCKQELPITAFYKHKRGFLGIRSECKACNKVLYPDKNKKHYAQNKAVINERARLWREENKDRVKEYRQANKHVYNAHQQRREAFKIKATPKWLTKEDLQTFKDIYLEASYFGYHVDHIIPLLGKLVCGLHVPNNLQIIPASENIRKKNTFEVI